MNSPTSPATDTQPESPATPAPESTFHTPNAATGVFEIFEKVPLDRMPAGVCGEFHLAHTEAGFYIGYWLHIRSPKNTAKLAPSVRSLRFDARELALFWLVDNIAANFFADHKGAMKALHAWRAQLIGAPAAEPESAPAAAQSEPVPAPEVVSVGPVSAYYASIPVGDIEPNPHNPRREFAEAELRELADSIKAQGLLQPIAVRDLGEQREGGTARFRLVAGERRWRAHQLVGVPSIEAKVFSGVDDARAGEMALVENLQRHGLNPMEEAEGFADLCEKYGYTPEKISERTGKAESTIKNAIRIVRDLPADVRDRVRRRELSPSHARALASPRWASRPAHCGALAAWVVQTGVPTADLEAKPLPGAVLRALEAAKLAVNVSVYREHVDADALRDAKSDVVESADGALWHLAPAQWKEEKAEIDRVAREKAEREAARAAKRVEMAKAAAVNVKVEDLARAGLAYVPLTGDVARYAEYLPAEYKATGVGTDGEELLVCLRPAELAKLRERETALLVADGESHIGELCAEAQETIDRLKKIGPREMAFLVEAALGGDESTILDPGEFEARGLPPPADLTRATLAGYDPLALVKVYLWCTVLNSEGAQLADALRWILNRPLLGLAHETEEGRARVLAQAAAEVFPKVTTDPKILAEWQKAATMGMPFAEIARSYHTTEDDVRGALEGKRNA